MRRSKTGSPDPDARFADHLSIGLLARVYPPELINEMLNAHACNSARVRSFPAAAVVYYTMALSLFPQAAYEEVFGAVMQGLACDGNTPLAPVTVVKSTISKARSRLDWRALRAMQQRCCKPLSAPEHQNAFFGAYRLVAIEAATLDVCDQKENVLSFGYPLRATISNGPQARYAILAECASHAILDAELGPCTHPAAEVAAALARGLRPDMLCLADRGALAYADWNAARSSGAQLLWRITGDLMLPVERRLADGSYLSRLQPDGEARKNGAVGIVVRVITPAAGAPGLHLLTTLLNEKEASAATLAALYCERPQVDLHLGHGRRALRSKTPELVRQEFYGWVMAHYAVRWQKYQDAPQPRPAERDLSGTVKQIREDMLQAERVSRYA